QAHDKGAQEDLGQKPDLHFVMVALGLRLGPEVLQQLLGKKSVEGRQGFGEVRSWKSHGGWSLLSICLATKGKAKSAPWDFFISKNLSALNCRTAMTFLSAHRTPPPRRKRLPRRARSGRKCRRRCRRHCRCGARGVIGRSGACSF